MTANRSNHELSTDGAFGMTLASRLKAFATTESRKLKMTEDRDDPKPAIFDMSDAKQVEQFEVCIRRILEFRNDGEKYTIQEFMDAIAELKDGLTLHYQDGLAGMHDDENREPDFGTIALPEPLPYRSSIDTLMAQVLSDVFRDMALPKEWDQDSNSRRSSDQRCYSSAQTQHSLFRRL